MELIKYLETLENADEWQTLWQTNERNEKKKPHFRLETKLIKKPDQSLK